MGEAFIEAKNGDHLGAAICTCQRCRAPLPSVHVPPSANGTISESLISSIASVLLPTSRRCGGRRKCRGGGGNSSPPSPPPPPAPTRITQSLLLSRVNATEPTVVAFAADEYVGMYKLLVEAGWGISIGIYDETKRAWKNGVSATSTARGGCNGKRCGIVVRFMASIPSRLSHGAKSLSAHHFCSGFHKAARAHSVRLKADHHRGYASGSTRSSGTTLSPAACNEADVTVLATNVDEHDDSMSINDAIGIAVAVTFIGCLCFCTITGIISSRSQGRGC